MYILIHRTSSMLKNSTVTAYARDGARHTLVGIIGLSKNSFRLIAKVVMKTMVSG